MCHSGDLARLVDPYSIACLWVENIGFRGIKLVACIKGLVDTPVTEAQRIIDRALVFGVIADVTVGKSGSTAIRRRSSLWTHSRLICERSLPLGRAILGIGVKGRLVSYL